MPGSQEMAREALTIPLEIFIILAMSAVVTALSSRVLVTVFFTFLRWPTFSLRLLAVTSSLTGEASFVCLLLASAHHSWGKVLRSSFNCSGLLR